MNTDNPHKDELLQYLLAQQQPEALDLALARLLTPAEYLEISKRLQIFKQLDAGIAQRRIAQNLGVGIATVSRGARALAQAKSTP